MARSVRAGETLAPRELATIASGSFRLPDPEHLVHLQFRRYSGCPICHLHLRSFANRHAEIVAAGVREVAIFHSSAETMTGYQAELPFAWSPTPPGGSTATSASSGPGARSCTPAPGWR
jgi:hypothetical protein